jgi:hypothetical protein
MLIRIICKMNQIGFIPLYKKLTRNNGSTNLIVEERQK